MLKKSLAHVAMADWPLKDYEKARKTLMNNPALARSLRALIAKGKRTEARATIIASHNRNEYYSARILKDMLK